MKNKQHSIGTRWVATLLVGALVLAASALVVYLRKGDNQTAQLNDKYSDTTSGHSYNSGQVDITFKQGTSYTNAQAVLAKHNLININQAFMQPYATINVPVNIQDSPISELNAFYAKVDLLKHDTNVDHMTTWTVYFKQNTSLQTARETISKYGLSVASNGSLTMSTTARVSVPPGTEPNVITQLIKEASVQSASEPHTVTM